MVDRDPIERPLPDNIGPIAPKIIKESIRQVNSAGWMKPEEVSVSSPLARLIKAECFDATEREHMQLLKGAKCFELCVASLRSDGIPIPEVSDALVDAYLAEWPPGQSVKPDISVVTTTRGRLGFNMHSDEFPEIVVPDIMKNPDIDPYLIFAFIANDDTSDFLVGGIYAHDLYTRQLHLEKLRRELKL